MRLTWRRSNVQRRPQFSLAGGARHEFSHKLKFTPRLERLEDRTLLSDGVLDSTFGVNGLVTTNLSYINNNFVSPASIFRSATTHQNSVALQMVGGVPKIVVAGVSQGPTTAFSVGRFNTDGTLDGSFGNNGLVTTNFPGSTNDQANAAAIQSDGSIIVAGSTTVTTVNGPIQQFGLLRYTMNGILDTSFGKGGFVTIPTPNLAAAVNSVVVQANGRIVVAGTAGGNFAVARVHADGLQDSDFNGNGITVFNIGLTLAAAFVPPTGTVDTLTSMALQPDGQIVVAGYTNLNATKDGINAVPIGNTGVPNFNGQITNAQNMPVIVTGAVTGASNTSPIVITAINHGLTSGTQVSISNVNGNTAANSPPFWTITVIDADHFSLNGSTGNGNFTASPNATWQATTNTGQITITAPNHGLTSGTRVDITGVQGDTAANGFWTISVTDANHFTLNGSIGNADFAPSPLAAWSVVPPKAWNFAVARINAQNGLLDTSFNKGIDILDFFQALAGGHNFGLGDDMAEDVVVQPDNKILVAGRTWMDDNLQIKPNFGVARFNPDGTLDKNLNGDGLVFTDFATDFSDANDLAYSVGLQGDGKIVVAGSTDRLDAVNVPAPLRGTGKPGFALVRYNLNGTEDQTFGLHGEVLSKFTPTSTDQVTNIVMLPNGQIVVGGTTDQGSGPVFGLARYSGLQSGSFQFSQASYSVNENGGNITITVNRGGGTEGTVTVNYATSNGTALAGTDYTASAGTLTFATGQSTATFTVPVMSDGVYQPTNKVFNLTLSNPTGGAFLGFQSTATVTLVETDQPGSLAFSAAGYSVNQNGGNVTITVNRSSGSAGPVGISYGTHDGTALAGTDYTATNGTLSFAAGETSKTFTIPILNSGAFLSPAPTFTVSLLTPTGGATLGSPNTATVTIVQTNQPGVLAFSAAAYTVAENAGNVTLTVTRPGSSSAVVTVNYATSDGTAVAGVDYTATAGTLTFTPAQTSATITIPIRDDGVFQLSNKTFTVTLSNPTGGAPLGMPSTAVVTLQEKDGTPNQLFIAQAYRDVLQRDVDPGGLANWTNFLSMGGTRQQFAQVLVTSVEYRQLTVTGLYARYLHRAVDPTGLAGFTAFLAGGGTDEQISAMLAASPEYFQVRGGGTNSGFVSALYQDALGRPADATGLAGYSQALANGVSRLQIATIFVTSTEYFTNLVQGFYQHFLHRAADPTGLNGFVTALQTPPAPVQQPIIGSNPVTTNQQLTDEALIALFVGSDEYFMRVTQ